MSSALIAIVTFAAGTIEDKPSKIPFYVLGGGLALCAVLLSVAGIARHATFPASDGLMRGLMALFVLLVAGAMLSAVLTA